MGNIISEKVVYNRYLTVFDREVEFTQEGDPSEGGGDGTTTSRRITYDIVGHPKSAFQFAVVGGCTRGLYKLTPQLESRLVTQPLNLKRDIMASTHSNELTRKRLVSTLCIPMGQLVPLRRGVPVPPGHARQAWALPGTPHSPLHKRAAHPVRCSST
jgi:hypothetical protein